VTTLQQRWSAERAVQHVHGVRAIANDIDVRPDHATARTDSEIAEAAANALAWNSAIPLHKVHVAVRNGWVTLSGELEWHYQRRAADLALRALYGVKGVFNEIKVAPRVDAGDIKAAIESAFKRSAEIDAARVRVESHDGEVILSGTVRSLSERTEAERAAWSAPGVRRVDDQLVVAP
jgi:osmotically-inducible protein OsmY